MPDILIRGMEMPGSCAACDFYNVISGRCTRTGTKINFSELTTRSVDCPISELPPHGDLISSENVIETIERLRDKSGNDEMAFALNWALRLIREKPVIIPADKEEHNG